MTLSLGSEFSNAEALLAFARGVTGALEPTEFVAKLDLPSGDRVRLTVMRRKWMEPFPWSFVVHIPDESDGESEGEAFNDDDHDLYEDRREIGSGYGYGSVEDAIRAFCLWALMRLPETGVER